MARRFENDNPFMPWNEPWSQDDPFKPWNDGMHGDDPFAPWNNPLSDKRDYDEYCEKNRLRR